MADELVEKDVKQWIEKGPSADLIKKTEVFGRRLEKTKPKLSTSQIRQVFSKLKSIEAKGFTQQRTAFLMLKPLMAYAAARHGSQGLGGIDLLKERLTWGIDAVFSGTSGTEETRFNHFCRLFEAILAYHRAAGGK